VLHAATVGAGLQKLMLSRVRGQKGQSGAAALVSDTPRVALPWAAGPSFGYADCVTTVGKGDKPAATRNLTQLLQAASDGQPGASDELLSLVYEHLHSIAQARMAQERPGHTLQATALVHEVYLRVLGEHKLPWNGRAHFFHVAAEAMRRLLIEHARSRGRVKRGGDRQRVPLSVLELADVQDEEQILALDGAMRRLEDVDPEAAEVVRLRFFAGLSVEQASEALNISARTIKRDWAFARAWLHQALHGQV
jgi:RNA polymerase sigma factor (TIGR02999 family)